MSHSQQSSKLRSQSLVLVTGASSGIGEALALRVAADGHGVILVARRAERLERLAERLRAEFKVEVHTLPADLTEPRGVEGIVAELERRELQVDWLINNAGFGTLGRFHELPIERELDTVRCNLLAAVELTGRLLPAMVQRKRGVVINVSSLGGLFPSPLMATYTATKAFVVAFSESIASELRGTGVSVLCVCPGFTRTEFPELTGANSAVVPAMAWSTAEAVADETVRAALRGGTLVNGTANRVLAAAFRLLPRGLSSWVFGSLLHRALPATTTQAPPA